MRTSGKFVVLSIFALAMAMAGFALWWNWGLGRRSLNYWGDNGALLIRDAKSVILFKLEPPIAGSAARNAVDLGTAKSVDVTNVKGLVHARHSFLEDASYVWDQSKPADIEWEYALLFQGGSGRICVMLDLKHEIVGSSETSQALRLSSKTAAGWKSFVGRYFPEDGETPKVTKASKSPAKTK